MKVRFPFLCICLFFPLTPSLSRAQERDDTMRIHPPKTKSEATERAVAWLVRQQREDGTWPGIGLANTALGTLAVAEGAGPFLSGAPFFDSVRKGRKALTDRLVPDFGTVFQEDPIGVSIAVFCLVQTPDFGEKEPTRTCLSNGLETICRSQRCNGRWQFRPDEEDDRIDGFLTAWAALALEAAIRAKLSTERCRESLSRYALGCRSMDEGRGDPVDDASALSCILSAHARALLSDSQDETSVGGLVSRIFPPSGASETERESNLSACQLSFLLWEMTQFCHQNEFGLLVSSNKGLVQTQISEPIKPPGKDNELQGVGHWRSDSRNEFRIVPAVSISFCERSDFAKGAQAHFWQIQDTCFCILRLVKELQIRFLPRVRRIAILQADKATESDVAPNPIIPQPGPLDKIKRRW